MENNFSSEIRIGDKVVGLDHPTYFIADVAANHDGDLERANDLICLAKEVGADAVKFQNHNCEKYVSDFGFKHLGKKMSHQGKWDKTIYEVYKDAEVPFDWTEELKEHAEKMAIEYFSTPYDLDTADQLDPYMNVYKIGSGDINWDEMLVKVASKNKPVIISSGASTIGEVQHAVDVLGQHSRDIILLQCNTNYTAATENFKHISLNVLKTYQLMFPGMIVGLSDHTHGHSTVLGAIALGARVIEKHFTDDTSRKGPDHPFSMTPKTWKEMVERSREVEYAMGDFNKHVQENEKETIILQRRCIRAKHDLEIGKAIVREDIEMQRPAPEGSIPPNSINLVLGRVVRKAIREGEHVSFDKL